MGTQTLDELKGQLKSRHGARRIDSLPDDPEPAQPRLESGEQDMCNIGGIMRRDASTTNMGPLDKNESMRVRPSATNRDELLPMLDDG